MLPTIAQLVSKYELQPLKKYGQNFIYDESLCDKIVKYAGINSNSKVLEVGPGPAGLTRAILRLDPDSCVVIEMDQRFAILLNEIKSYYPKLSIKQGDALNVSLSDLTDDKIDIVSNLPYNVGCKLLTNWLEEIELVNSITVMLQKEVVERIIAKPSCKDYGRLSIICQILCDVEKCFDVSPKVFYPPPKVHSAVIKLVPKNIRISQDMIKKIQFITMHAFSNRRKALKNSLQALPNHLIILEKLGIDALLRPENLSPNDYHNIAMLTQE
ncbi:MAG: 16S rRNA (adenine(1518)-N(6)/adenine(1519)-N(6))-dimethyltransferase RsmA [Rickettsiaceae bacterium]|nr:16S rRNA (adenine(1518)-N(6)/adenine(1519)-N(6))-dimethyltransferase RsmA [Rickettsiaceae bacterium]